MSTDFLDVTELRGSAISAEQLDRLINRYTWAATYCQGKDVIEVACGAGPGLGLLADVPRSHTAHCVVLVPDNRVGIRGSAIRK